MNTYKNDVLVLKFHLTIVCIRTMLKKLEHEEGRFSVISRIRNGVTAM